jgi:transaldolase
MKATQKLHEMGQSLWLDNITRGLLTSGTLRRYIHEFSVTGLTSNPTIFDHAIKNSHDYDDAIRQKLKEDKSGEALFFELALEDLGQAADLFRPIYDQTDGVDGWVSLEVSPLLAHDTKNTLEAAKELHDRGKRPNMYIKIPGTKEGLPAIEEAIFTVNTMPEGTLNALAEHGKVDHILPPHGGDCEEVLTRFAKAGIDIDALAAQLQDDGARSLVKSWKELMACMASKREALK